MKPRLLLYCQHSLGLGHFIRSLALAEALEERFDICFFNGGPVPQLTTLPAAIRFTHLPPLRMDEDGSLVGDGDVGQIMLQRSQTMLKVAAETPVAALVVELYPFGRKKFAPEIDPLIAHVKAQGGKIVCSVRDVLVNERVDQSRHDQRAADALNANFDAVLVHSDDRIFRLDESFKPANPISIPVEHTGFVVRAARQDRDDLGAGTLVTAGGGIVGHALYHAAVAAQPILWERHAWPMTLVAGPLFPETDWAALMERAAGVGGLSLYREVNSMSALLSSAGRVISQCGYNSALEIVQYGLPTLFVPFARGQESEQTMRARQLSQLGMCEWMAERDLDGTGLAQRLTNLTVPAPTTALNIDGAANSARIIADMLS